MTQLGLPETFSRETKGVPHWNLALRKLFFPTKQKTKNPTGTYKENEPYGSKLALAGN